MPYIIACGPTQSTQSGSWVRVQTDRLYILCVWSCVRWRAHGVFKRFRLAYSHFHSVLSCQFRISSNAPVVQPNPKLQKVPDPTIMGQNILYAIAVWLYLLTECICRSLCDPPPNDPLLFCPRRLCMATIVHRHTRSNSSRFGICDTSYSL